MNDLFGIAFLILQVVCAVCLGFFLKNLLPSYFSEKGKNLAVKEDIEKITTLVEEVKSEFTRDIEMLKANLQVATNLQIGHKAEERKAIIELNLKYFRWVNLLLDTSMDSIDQRDNKQLSGFRGQMDKKYQDFLDSETLFSLFVNNAQLIHESRLLKIETLRVLASCPAVCTFSLAKNNNSFSQIHSDDPNYSELIDASLAERDTILNEFRTSVLQIYAALNPQVALFQTHCKEYLQAILA